MPDFETGVGRGSTDCVGVDVGATEAYGYQVVILDVLYAELKSAVMLGLANPVGDGIVAVAPPVPAPPIAETTAEGT